MSDLRAEARRHISSLRAARGLSNDDNVVNTNDPNLTDLTRVLALTSSELYAEGFHFVWELIQNSDDANYRNQQPRLHITLTNDALYAWSNQVGFSKADVESVCRVGRSSKISRTDTTGEKGIGFKSLFTVADKVTIHSAPYHFKFDTTTLGHLGMVVPTWVGEPVGVTHEGFAIPTEGTTISLQLKSTTDIKALRDKLEHLDLSFLVCCRRLKIVTVSCIDSATGFHRAGELRHNTDNTVDLQIKNSVGVLSSSRRFRVFSKTLTDMYPPADRPRNTTSSLRLAFTIPTQSDPSFSREMTYAFMPINQFGFNFLIHANFILTANREEVVPHHKWNIKLRTGLTDLVYSAIVWLATSADTSSHFQWPHFVASLYSIHDAFFQPLAVEVCNRLRTTPLLLTDAVDAPFFQTPTNALSVLNDFRTEGKLILDGNAIARKSVREDYVKDLKVRHALEKLGVRNLDHHGFLCAFEDMVQNEETTFRSKPMQWHASVAAVLLASRTSSFFSKCDGLDIVPLSTGDWASPKAANLFLPGRDIGDIPPALPVKIVDPAICTEKSRHLLFETLGIRTCTREQVCKAIVAAHHDRQRGSLKDTVIELEYLYHSKYEPKDTDFFRFYATPGGPNTADRSIHIQFGEIGDAVRKQLGTASTNLRWLHADYGNIPKDGQTEDFVAWLQKWPQLRLWPEISQDHKLAPVMMNLLTSESSNALLVHFRWRVKHKVSLPINDKIWKHDVSNLEVSTDQGLKKLCETALPKIAILSGGMVPSLDIAEPGDSTWSFLKDFGVITTINTRFFLQTLRNIKSAREVDLIDTKVTRLYLGLGKLEIDKELIRETFASEALIYVGIKGWVKSSSCRWEAEYACSIFHLLSKRYDRCAPLFKRTLGLKAADLDDLLEEFRAQAATTNTGSGYVDIDTAEATYELLLDMNKMLRSRPATDAQLAEMHKLRMFPILCASSDPGRMLVRVQRCTDTFWIGDTPWLQKRFKYKLPLLLPIDGKTLRGLNAVFKAFKMFKKKLTRCVINESKSEDPVDGIDEELTQSLRPKVAYLISLLRHVQETKSNRKKFVAQLDDLRVQRVRKIRICRYVKHGTRRIYGVDEEGEICLKPGEKELIIHMNTDLQEPDVFDALAEHLSKYWNLQHGNMQLVYKVLASRSSKRCTEAFEKAGITPPDSEQMNNEWTVSKQAMQVGGTRSNMTGGEIRFGEPSSSTHGYRQYGGGSGGGGGRYNPSSHGGGRRFNPYSRSMTSSGSFSRASNFSMPQWMYGPAQARVADDTTSQHQRYNSRRRHDCTPSVEDLGELTSPQQPYQEYGSSSSPLRKRKSETESSMSSEEQERAISKIGKEGERLVYYFLLQTLGSSFSRRNWTSRNRDAFFPFDPFPGLERDFSDFTYKDVDGRFGDYLRNNIPDYSPPPNDLVKPTYHLEVKTSLDGIETPAVLRNNQIRLARHRSRVSSFQNPAQQSDVYVLVRVYDLGKDPPTPKVCFFPDPWDLIFHGKLAIAGDEGVYIRPLYTG